MLVFVGLPYAYGSRLLSCAAAVYSGEVLALVPRENVAGSRFAAYTGEGDTVRVGALETELVPNVLFTHESCAVSPSRWSWARISTLCAPPAEYYAAEGATVIAQMASFPATASSTDDARLAARYQSKHLACGVVLAAPGKGESTTDNVYSGLCLAAEGGVILAEDECPLTAWR